MRTAPDTRKLEKYHRMPHDHLKLSLEQKVHDKLIKQEKVPDFQTSNVQWHYQYVVISILSRISDQPVRRLE
ncbi:hypothetical protein RvY_04943 [Ramazzottius varieornatus]|uniref:Uncharacterized protein n=1 Tax=Ramazzottius varieornatus TaxID=947166 RepID=A0A1D1UWI8_RAMVA|nr:hypothetical protein RvY_04943 [Ramazzottius varieornatus]